MTPDRPLSPLELTALGIVLKRGPCVAHAVVAEFQGSSTFAYRSGAGAVYPLLKRLVGFGLLGLEGRHYSLTEAGAEALRNWLRPPLDASALSTNLDLIRSRAYFLKLLPPAEVAAFIDYARDNLVEVLEECRATTERYRTAGDRFSEWAMRGAELETEARIAWLTEMRAALVEPEA